MVDQRLCYPLSSSALKRIIKLNWEFVFMKFHLLGVAFVIALSSPAFAECSKEIRSEKRNLEVAYSKVSKALKRATVALRSQERRASQLDEQALQGLEAAPVAPVADLAAFNKKGKIDLQCDDLAAADHHTDAPPVGVLACAARS